MSHPDPSALKRELEELLADLLSKKQEELAAISPRLRRFFGPAARYVLNDGKRLRPQLACWGYWGAGGESEAIKPASLSLELIHSYLLVHDDIIDRDEVRRGQPTVHVAYRTATGGEPNEHLGVSLAIIAGDVLSSLGYQLITDSEFPAEARLRAVARLNRLIDEVIAGEYLDVLSGYVGDSFSEEDIRAISHYKTAAYTIDGPLQIGGLLAGASEELLGSYRKYAIPIGIAFQLRDDVLGVFGNPEETGKSVSSDLEEGKRTLLARYALEMAPAEDAGYLRHWLGNPQMGQAECERIRSIMHGCGALRRVEDAISELQAASLEALAAMPTDEETKRFLGWLADFIVTRTK